MLLWFCSKFYFCVFIFINPRHHIQHSTVRGRLYKVEKSAVDRFTYQYDNAHNLIAKFAIFFSQQNNVPCMYHLIWLHLNTFMGLKLCYCMYSRVPKPKTLKKLKTFLQDLTNIPQGRFAPLIVFIRRKCITYM